ncbi:MAG TPA: hypothetical protein VFP84_36700 [Kofleriaceae bacterium]|nr:hypothetical protein [Kofleriaceae bacterium]
MSAAEKIATSPELASWVTLRARHPDEWLCLTDVEPAADGAIRCARVLGHARSMRDLLAQLGEPPPGATVIHTGGRPITTPRLELTDAIRDVVRPRR